MRVVALAAMYCGVPVRACRARVLARTLGDHDALRRLCDVMRPGLVFAADGPAFEPALRDVIRSGVEIVTLPCRRSGCGNAAGASSRRRPPPARSTMRTPRDRRHHRQSAVHVGIDRPAERRDQHAAHAVREPGADADGAGVSRRRTAGALRLAAVEPHVRRQPQLRHRPLQRRHVLHRRRSAGAGPDRHARWRNLREVATTAYFNVPRGFEMLLPALRDDADFRRLFFSRLQIAVLRRRRPAPADRGRDAGTGGRDAAAGPSAGSPASARPRARRSRCAPARCLSTDDARRRAGAGPRAESSRPSATSLEARLRGPNITPGYWGDEELTRAAFDEEGFYRMGDAMRLVDPDDPSQGFMFDGPHRRGLQAVDRHMGAGRSAARPAPRARRRPRTGRRHHRSRTRRVGALIFPNATACRAHGCRRIGCARRWRSAASAPSRQTFVDRLRDVQRDQRRQLDERQRAHSCSTAAVVRRTVRSPTRARSTSAPCSTAAPRWSTRSTQPPATACSSTWRPLLMTATPNDRSDAADRDRRARPPRGTEERQRRGRSRDEVLRRRRRASATAPRSPTTIGRAGWRACLHRRRAAHRPAPGVERRRRRVRARAIRTSRSRSRASIRRAAPKPCARRGGSSPTGTSAG